MERVYNYYVKKLPGGYYIATYPGLEGFETVTASSMRKLRKRLYIALAQYLLRHRRADGYLPEDCCKTNSHRINSKNLEKIASWSDPDEPSLR